jgi:hypothetical protein
VDIHGKLTSDYQTTFDNYKILLLFIKKNEQGGWTPTSQTFAVESSGNFTLSLPERTELMDALTLQVQAPDETALITKSYLFRDGGAGGILLDDGSGGKAELEIKVGLKTAFTIKGLLYRVDAIEALPEEKDYAQHQVIALYSHLVDSVIGKWDLVKVSFNVQADGHFTLSLPDKDSRGNAITLEVHAPAETLLVTKHYLVEGPQEGKVTIKGVDTEGAEYTVEQLAQEPIPPFQIQVNPQPASDMLIKGQLVRDRANPDQSQQDSECQYEGHKIVTFFKRSHIDMGEPESRIFEVERNGKFSLSLPDIKQPFEFKLIAPDNEELFSQAYFVRLKDDKFLLVESESGEGDPKNEIEIQPKNYFEIQKSNDPFLEKFSARRSFKLTGAVLDTTGRRIVPNKQVLLWGRLNGTEADQFILILATRTDPQGYFSGDYPLQLRYKPHSFIEAYGVVGVGQGKRVPIPLENDFLPEKIVLVIEIAEGDLDGEDDCNCQALVPRAPDHIDFANSTGTYSTDLEAGTCVNFTTPNRTLEEFSFYSVVRTTDPEILYGPGNPNIIHPSTANKERQAERRRLDADNWVDWDETPTTYQSTTIAHGHLLHFKQMWKADGYSLGDLLYSLPLAPCQKKQIAVIDWDRSEQAARFETGQETESLSAAMVHDRDISEIVDLSLSEHIAGGSTAKTSSAGGGLGLGFIGKGFGALLGVSGGGSKSSSSAWQNSSRNLSTNSLHQLRDATMQSASAVRTQRTTVIQTMRQGEDVRVQTEVVANHNHCHAITVQYFEVLRHFLITQELVDVQECLFIPLLMDKFDQAKALRWREPLQHSLRNRNLRRGFEAMERRANGYKGDFPTGKYSQDIIQYVEGELYLTFRLARPVDSADGFNLSAWSWLTLLGLKDNAQEFYDNYLKNQAQKDEIFQRLLGSRVAGRIVDRLRFFAVNDRGHVVPLSLDTTLMSSYQHNQLLRVNLRSGSSWPNLKREDINHIHVIIAIDNNVTPPSDLLPANSEVIVQSGAIRYRTKFMAHNLFNYTRIGDDLKERDGTRIYTPLSQFELRDPHKEDEELEQQLLAHLNEHLEYYHKIIWWTMDKDRRYMMLDGFKAPNTKNRSVASVVENRLIGIVGNCLVMPVAPGFKLDPTYCQRDVDDPVDLLHLYAPTTPIDPIRVSVPTRGVFAEAMMGSCNSCETKDDTRFWRFEESPCGDEPTAIQPIGTDSRRAEPGDLQAKDFPAPMINLQNVPAAPDPTGLTAALQLLGAPNLFKDITGLEGNQRNALAALQSSLETAKFFGGEAAKLAIQKQMSGDINKAMQSIKQARQEDLITDEQARDLTNNALRGMVGNTPEPAEPQRLIDNPTVQDVVKRASQGGNSEITIDQPGERIQIKNPEIIPTNFVSDSTVPLGFDAGSLVEAARKVRLDEIIDELRGQEGLYKRFNIPDGGWRVTRGGNRWIDFWRNPNQQQPEVYNFIEGLLETPERHAQSLITQLTHLEQQGRGLDIGLTLASAYRESGGLIYGGTGLINTFSQGGLDMLGEVKDQNGNVVDRGELYRLRRRGYIRTDFYSESVDPVSNEKNQTAYPLKIRANTIVEATGAVLNLRHSYFLDAAEDLDLSVESASKTAIRIWTVAFFMAPGDARRILREFKDDSSINQLDQIIGSETFQRYDIIKRGHISAGESEILDNFLVSVARDTYNRRRLTPSSDTNVTEV